VMDLIYGCGSTEGWRSLFDNAMDSVVDEVDNKSIDTDSSFSLNSRIPLPKSRVSKHIFNESYINLESNISDFHRVDSKTLSFPSKYSNVNFNPTRDFPLLVRESPDESYFNELPSHIPSQVEFDNGVCTDVRSLGDSFIDKPPVVRLDAPNSLKATSDKLSLFKIVDEEGHTFLLRCDKTFTSLVNSVSEKLDGIDCSLIRFYFIDGDGDTILITSDDCLNAAASLASDCQAVKLNLSLTDNSPRNIILNQKYVLVFGFISVIAATAIVLVISSRSKK